MKKQLLCLNCNIKIVAPTNHPGKKFCNHKCRYQFKKNNPNYIYKNNCKYCGNIFINKKASQIFCSRRCQEYHWRPASRDRSRKKLRENRKKLIDYFGGKCTICGYNKCHWSLEFHHKDSSMKEVEMSAIIKCVDFNKILKEAEKCILVCSNCHREIEYKKHYGK